MPDSDNHPGVGDGVTERFIAALSKTAGEESSSLRSICAACMEVLSVDGASVVLMSRGDRQGIAAAVDGLAKRVQDEEFIVGEGPGSDACGEGEVILAHDMAAITRRWPHLGQAVAGTGLRAVYAMPLRIGAIVLGALVLYRTQPVVLAPQDLADALAAADVVSRLVLSLQAEASSEALAWSLDIADSRAVVHQATGMIAAQRDENVEEALVRLRGHAFGVGKAIDEVAADVVEGRLRFDVP